ncbi:MAG: hypothetical protein QG574_561 [Cyanobacteriota bacterium erpe_2018_sw_21hr_WHONDRS-SW48-000092_B_bin.40]|nr:hypothetical protein [Cyanobacteriota bacterium erpe_2018_sw_21hr_WHONDRS-SW48-000092_B_bin.40]
MSQNDSSPSNCEKDLKGRQWMAVNDPDTPTQDLEIIVSTGCRGLVRRAAEHPRVSVELLTVLSAHDDPEIRAAVVDNHQTSIDLHWKLAQDSCDDVRYAVAESYIVNMEVLSSLLEDSNPYISHRARATLKKRNVQFCLSSDFTEAGQGRQKDNKASSQASA